MDIGKTLMNKFPEGIRSVDFVRAIGNLVDNAFECDDDELVVPTHISNNAHWSLQMAYMVEMFSTFGTGANF